MMGNMSDGQSVLTPRPVFLFGFDRSGTTLLSMMVGAHPRIAVPFALNGLWYRYGKMLGKYNNLRTADDVGCLVDDLLQEERVHLWDVELTRDDVLASSTPRSYAEIIDRFHSLYAQHKGKDRWGNLDIATLDHMEQAYAWFPAARFIHIVRDGRDVALSHETYAYGASNLGECADKWVRRLQVNLKMGAILGPDRYLVVRYEDLVLESEPVLHRICGFLDVAYSPKMLAYPDMVAEKVPADRRWLWPALDKPPQRSRVYRWKMEMGTTKRLVFESTAQAMLAELGYETYARVPKRPQAYLLELWYFLGRGGRFRRWQAKIGWRRCSSGVG